MTNLHLVANEEQVWVKRSIWDRIAEVRPNMGLTRADRELLGSLAEIKTWSDHPAEIMREIYECTRKMDRSSPMARMRTLCGLDRAYELLIDAGYDNFRPEREQMQIGLRRFTATALRQLTRSMLSTDDDEKAEEISQFLVEVIAEGKWSQAAFNAEYESWVAEMQSRRVC
jgi:hypothetical protein